MDLVLPKGVAAGKEVKGTVNVTNVGDRFGEEVVCVYTNDVISSVTTPVKELQVFRRIALKPDEVRTVCFSIPSDRISLYNLQMRPVVEPGIFDVSVGSLRSAFEVFEDSTALSENTLKTCPSRNLDPRGEQLESE